MAGTNLGLDPLPQFVTGGDSVLTSFVTTPASGLGTASSTAPRGRAGSNGIGFLANSANIASGLAAGTRRGSILSSRANGPTAFEKLVPNFVSKHVREYVDDQLKRISEGKALGASGATAVTSTAAAATAHLAGSAKVVAVPAIDISVMSALPKSGTAELAPWLDSEPASPFDKSLGLSLTRSSSIVTPLEDSLSADKRPSFPTSGLTLTNSDGTTKSARGRKSSNRKEKKTAIDMSEIVRNLQPVAIEGWAAVVMCDVSGYSSLTSYLADRGPDGAEIMSKIMKGYLDKIIQIISLHGGDIVKFVGDAVIFYWKYTEPSASWLKFAETRIRDDHPDWPKEKIAEWVDRAKAQRQGSPVVKAAECCLDLLNKLKNYRVKIPPLPTDPRGESVERELKIHLGIGAGKIYDVHVGGNPGRWEHFVVGDAMEQLATVLDLAKPGQVALSKKAFEWFKHCVVLGRVNLESYDTKKCYILNGLDKTAINLILPENEGDDGDDFMALWDIQLGDPTTSGNIELYRQYINQSALFKLESDIQSASPFQLNQGVNHLMSLNELRQVTTVFIKIGSLSFAPVEAVEEAIKEQEAYISEQHANILTLEREVAALESELQAKGSQESAAVTADAATPTANEPSPTTPTPASVAAGNRRKLLTDRQATLQEARTAVGSSQAVLGTLKVDHGVALREALARCQAAMTSVQVALKKYEGILRQFHVDDKGAVILAFFGLPPLAHKNDATLGVQAAMMICEELKRHFEVFSIGLTTGVVSIGGVGNSLRTEYALMGDSINMAARLMSLPDAKRNVVCDERTYSLCTTSFEFEELGQAVVKGKAMPINIYQPVQLKAVEKREVDRSPTSSMIGRVREQQAVHDIFERHGRGGASNCSILVEGEGGQGVSTFGGFVRDTAETADYAICIGACVESEKSTPYFALRGVIRDLLRILEESQLGEDGALRVSPPGANLFRPRSLLASAILNASRGKLGLIQSTRASNDSVANQTAANGQVVAPTDVGFRSSDQHISGGAQQQQPTSDRVETEFEGLAKRALSRLRETSYPARVLEIVFPEEFPSDLGGSMMNVGAGGGGMSGGGGGVGGGASGGYGMFGRQQDLTSMLQNALNALSNINRLMVMLPDAHFMDRASWEVLRELVESCPRVLFVVLSHPAKHLSPVVLEYYEQYRKLASLIVLQGLSQAEVGELVMQSFNRLEVSQGSERVATSTDPLLAAKVFTVSGGNPLFASSLVVSLREKSSLDVTETGRLTFFSPPGSQGKAIVLDAIMPGSDLHSLIVSQFDRLDPMFQMFLKIASVLGQHFMLRDVLDYFEMEQREGQGNERGSNGGAPLGHRDTDALIQDIDKFDRYGFLTLSGNLEVGALVSFKNTIIRDSIYSTMLIAQRQALHLGFAKFYERRLEIADYAHDTQLILKVYEHYQKAEGQTEKKLVYLERVAHLYFASHSVSEAVAHYRDLLTMPAIQKWPIGTRALRLPSGREFTYLDRSRWHKELGDAYMMLHRLADAEVHFTLALAWVGYFIPTNPWMLHFKSFLEYWKLKPPKARAGLPRSASTASAATDTASSRRGGGGGSTTGAGGAPAAAGDDAGGAAVESAMRLQRLRGALLSLIELCSIQEFTATWRFLVWSGATMSAQTNDDPVSAALFALAGFAVYTTKKNTAKAMECIEHGLLIAERASGISTDSTLSHAPAAGAPAAATGAAAPGSTMHVALPASSMAIATTAAARAAISNAVGPPPTPMSPRVPGDLDPANKHHSLSRAAHFGHSATVVTTPAAIDTRLANESTRALAVSIALTCSAAIDLLAGRLMSARDRCTRVMRLADGTGGAMVVFRAQRMLILMDLLDGRHVECKAMANDLWIRTKDRSRDSRFWSLANMVLLDINLKGLRSHAHDPTFLHFVNDMKRRIALLSEDSAGGDSGGGMGSGAGGGSGGGSGANRTSGAGAAAAAAAAAAVASVVPSGASLGASNAGTLLHHGAGCIGRRLVEVWMSLEFEFWRRKATGATAPAVGGGGVALGGSGGGAGAADDGFFVDRMNQFVLLVRQIGKIQFHAVIGIIGTVHLISMAYESDLVSVFGSRRQVVGVLRETIRALKARFADVPWTRWIVILAEGMSMILENRKSRALAMWEAEVAATVKAGEMVMGAQHGIWLTKVVAAKLSKYSEGRDQKSSGTDTAAMGASRAALRTVLDS
ncbi:hypothetical protein H9P43_008131 [Blastocladiella emersonii ATCC 22665]|nr:hypothetical protein H9P43_008131 [Blastocladiella emersonii ATCC 22665]